MNFALEGQPFAPYLVALDFVPGTHAVPGLGNVWLGLTPNLLFPLMSTQGGPPIPASGTLNLPIPINGTDGSMAYLQAAMVDGPSTALSNAKSIELSLPDSYHSTQGMMSQARAFHRAVPLDDGSVLVVGGGSGAFLTPTSTSQCDIYDPYLRQFVATAPMATPRTLHTATRLQDGRVLVTGGSLTLGVGIASTEIYDPAMGTWTAGPALSSTRIAHTATLLDDGRVLICGGTSTFNIPVGSTNYGPIFLGSLASAELFDPASMMMTPVPGPMSDARMAHSATILNDGRVLLVGGIRSGQTVFGISAPLYAQSSDLFDPMTNTFQTLPGLNVPRVTHTANLLPSGEVLILGGAGGTLVSTLDTTELFSPTAQTFATSYQIPGTTLALHGAVNLLDGTVYFSGGAVGAVGSFSAIPNAFRYRPGVGIQSLSPLPVSTQALTATWTDEGVLLLGGGLMGSMGTPTSAARIWTPTL